MSAAAFSLKVFAVYLAGLGLGLLAAPNPLLTLFGFPPSHEVWVRVLGVVVINLGVYYWYGAMSDARPLFAASVATRLFVLIAFVGLVVAGQVQPMLILFGAIDAAGGLWTLWALRSASRGPSPTDR
jgi:hypothetical protein